MAVPSERLIITCEHGGNEVPPAFAPLFDSHRDLVESHRGFDWGALELARELSGRFRASLYYSTVTRLLVDLNRSPRSRTLFSEITRPLDRKTRIQILETYYWPFRDTVESRIRETVAQGRRVLHVSVHSFTPVMKGVERNTDIGLLYDPRRTPEVTFCDAWAAALLRMKSPFRVRRNYPYLGQSDGFATYLRRLFPARVYTGIELETNRRHVENGGDSWEGLKEVMLRSLGDVLEARGRRRGR